MKDPALICIHAPRPKPGSREHWGLCFACQETVDDQMRAAVEEEREACAKAKCQMCRDGDPLTFGVPPGENVPPLWFHANPAGESPIESAWDVCRSAAIRARGQH